MQGRIGVQKAIEHHVLQSYPQALQMVQNQLKDRLGRELIDQLESSHELAVVRLRWVENEVDGLFERLNLGLIADLYPVTKTQITIAELPPFQFYQPIHSLQMIVEWQCAYCGTVNIADKHLECRKCGAPRKTLR